MSPHLTDESGLEHVVLQLPQDEADGARQQLHALLQHEVPVEVLRTEQDPAPELCLDDLLKLIRHVLQHLLHEPAAVLVLRKYQRRFKLLALLKLRPALVSFNMEPESRCASLQRVS